MHGQTASLKQKNEAVNTSDDRFLFWDVLQEIERKS